MLPYFNPRSPHGERRMANLDLKANAYISIHAPRTGSDIRQADVVKNRLIISIHAPRTGSDRSRPVSADFPKSRISIHAPRTGSDAPCAVEDESKAISIHAPRTGSDTMHTQGAGDPPDFNPRSPHGERHALSSDGEKDIMNFNPRSPHGERHCFRAICCGTCGFQSTLPARGATVDWWTLID